MREAAITAGRHLAALITLGLIAAAVCGAGYAVIQLAGTG